MRTSKFKEFDKHDNARKESGIFYTRTSARTHRGASRTQRTAAAATRMSKPLLTLATAMLVLTLIVSSAWIFNSAGVFAAGTDAVTASSLTNNNIGKHPLHALLSWDATGENLQNGGRFNWGAAVTGDYVKWTTAPEVGIEVNKKVEDFITPQFITTMVNSTLKDNGGDTILEQSPIFTYKRETVNVNGETYTIYVDTNGKAVYFDEVAQSIALKYGFREGKELVFNINDEGTAARVWADAVLFTQHIGPAECIPFVSYVDHGRYREDTGLIPDTTMYAFADGDYIFRTKLQPEEIEAGSVVYNEYSDTYGVWEKYGAAESKDGNSDYVQNGGKVQRYAHFFVNDNGSYYYHTDTKQMTTSEDGVVETYGTHKVKYSLYDINFTYKEANHVYNETNDPDLMPGKGTLNVHGPVYRGNYFIENGRYEGWGETSAYGGAKLMGQYITVRLNCDWTAKEITTDIYTVEGKTTSFDYVYDKADDSAYAYKTFNDSYKEGKSEEKYLDTKKSSDNKYTVYYDASSIPFATGNTPFTPYNELCAFSNGRINVPVGSYIVLDLNGHKIDRALSVAYDKNPEDSAYQYFGSVFAVNEFARLEVYDGTAFENASDTHISGENKDKPESNYGANGGLTTDQKGTITGGYVTHQFTKDGGNGRAVHEGNELKNIGDSNFKTQLTKLKLKTDDEVHTDFASTIADDNQAKGAAIHLFSHSDFVLHSGTISGNNAASQYGGAVYLLTNSSMTMFDGYVINNQSYRIGGGIYLADASASVLTMYNGVVGYNYGGAGKLTIDRSNDLREDGLKQFRTIENYGGGIALRTKAYCNLYGGELVGNYSYGPGAGMYIQATAVGTLAGVTIKGNHTYGAPGGQGGSFAPFGGGGGIFVGGTGARIGFRGALQIVENYRDNTVNDYQGKNLDSPTDGEELKAYPEDPNNKETTHVGTHKTITDIVYTSTEGKNTRADNLYLPMREMTKDTTPTNPNTNTMNEVGEKTDGAKASTNYDKRWDSNASIVISGPLIEKGIVANIGITMQAATSYFNADDNTDKKLNEDGTTESSENIKLVFTQHYTKNGDSQHNDIAAHYFFTSDNPNYSVQMNGNEGMLKNNKATETKLTWVVEGKGIDADTKADAQGAPVLSDLRVIVKPDGTLEYWYKNPNRSGIGDFKDTLAQVTASTKIESAEVELSNKDKTQDLLKILNDSFVATSGSLDFEYSMLNVTKVAVYSDTPNFTATGTIQSPLASWEVTNTGSSFGISSTFYTANFRFKLGEEDLEFKNADENAAHATVPEENRMFKAIKATDESISYAGLYSFLYKSDTMRYENPTFKINIKQVGIEATRTCYFDGKDVTERTPVPWKEDEEFSWNIGTDNTKNREPYAPYFLYRGDYYYPVLSADYNNPVKGSDLVAQYASQGGLEGYIRPRLTENTFLENDYYIRVVDPEKSGDCLFVRKEAFNGYVLNFRYSNQYFGVTRTKIGTSNPVEVAITTDVHFGAHDGGGVEYKTLHKKPGSEVAEGQYVDGVKHAGTYLVTFVASSNGLTDDTGVYFASNNFAFNAEVRLQVKPANAEVQLTDNARNNLGYFGTKYEDRQIAEFDNTSDTKIIPVNDNAVIFRYFLFDDEAIWTGDTPSLDDLKQDVLAEKFKLKGGVTAQKYKEDGTPNTIPGTQVEPLNARTYIVVVTLELDMNYEEYDYVFTKDPAHLVNIDVEEGKESNVWAYWFTIDPAEINPYEITSAATSASGNTSVTLGTNGSAKSVYYKNVSYAYEYTYNAEDGSKTFEKARFAETANLPTIKFGNTELQLGTDYTVEYSGFAPEQAGGSFNYVDASVGLDSKGPAFDGRNFGAYNLAVKITFGGRNKNYVNKEFTTGSADDKGTAYEDEKGAFYVYFRIVPVIVTASASISYTYDGGSYDRGRFLEATGSYSDWYESIFFLAQDSKTLSSELLSKQHNEYNNDNKNDLDEIWGGIQGERSGATYDDTTFYMSRYTIGDVNVSYSNSDFIAHGIQLGVGMYAFQTGSPDAKTTNYRLSTIDFDNEESIDVAPEQTGVMWLLTVGNVQTHASTNSDTEVTNFIINADSYLNVMINQKNVEGDDVKVLFNGVGYPGPEGKTPQFPYSGYAYKPTVELYFNPLLPCNGDAGQRKTNADADNNKVTLAQYSSDTKYDYYVNYNSNTAVSTDTSKAQAIVIANKNSAGGSFSSNYYGQKTIDFEITPAVIQVTYAPDSEHVFTYDRLSHPAKIKFTNTSDYSSYLDNKIIIKSDGTPVQSGDSGDFVPPLPNENSNITIQYKKLDPASSSWVSSAPINAGTYRVAVYSASENFMFADSQDFKLYNGEDATTGTNRTVTTIDNFPSGDKGTSLVINRVKVYVDDIETTFTYNRAIQVPQLQASNIFAVKLEGSSWKKDTSISTTPVGSMSEYTLSYTNESPSKDGSYSSTGYSGAGSYWFVIDLQPNSDNDYNFEWGEYNTQVQYTKFEGNTRLAILYTIEKAKVVLSPDKQLSFDYDRNSHKVGVTFSSADLMPTSKEYELEYSYNSTFFGKELAQSKNYTNAGTYKLTVSLKDSNFAWNDFEAWTSAYSAAQNTAPPDGNAGLNAGLFVKSGDGSNSVTIVFIINPAKVTVSGLDDVIFNRAIQLPTITFANKVNTSVLPTNTSDSATYEWGYWFDPANQWQTVTMPFAEVNFPGLPSYADEYTAHVVLLGDARGNFEITANSDALDKPLTGTPRAIVGYPTKDGAVDNDLLAKPEGAGTIKLSDPINSNYFDNAVEHHHYTAQYTINRLKLSLRQVTKTVVYDYKPNQDPDVEKTANSGRHLNTALEVDFYNVGGVEAEVSDVPYQIYILNEDNSVYAVFHYTTGMEEGNYAHLGPCSAENHGVEGTHKHMHFSYDANGTIEWNWDNISDVAVDGKTVGTCIQELRDAFTNVGKHSMVLVLDNGNYIIDGEGNAFTDNVTQPEWYKAKEKISQKFEFEITKATLNPFLFDSKDTSKTPISGSELQFTYDGKSHALWVWFTNNDNNATVLPDNEIPQSDTDKLTATNYYAQFGYSGWAGKFGTSAAVSSGTNNHSDVGTYTVEIALKDDGNFQFAGGATKMTLTYNINTLSINKDLLNLELSRGNYTMGADTIQGDFVYIARSWEPITNVYIQVSGEKKPLTVTDDYSLQYFNNFNQGTATVQISGTHNYSGSISLTFDIAPKSLGTATQNDDDIESKNDKEIQETLLTGTNFVYNGSSQIINVAFAYTPQGFSQVIMSSGADYTLKYYKKGDNGAWTEVPLPQSIRDAGTYRIVATGQTNYTGTYVVEFEVAKATVEVIKPANKTYNRKSQEATIAFNNLDGYSVVPTSDEYKVEYTVSAAQTLVDNARLDAGKPYYAGNYDVKVTLTGTGAANFRFRVSGFDDDAPQYTDNQTVVFTISQLGVMAVQLVSSVTYDGKSHFNGDLYGSTELRYGGIGAWTFSFSSMDGATPVQGISYNITYTTPDGKNVVVKIGGYTTAGDNTTVAPNTYYIGEEMKELADIQALNLFKDVVWNDGRIGDYTYTLSFEYANFYISIGGKQNTSNDYKFRVNPAVVQLDTFESKVYNGLEQEPEVSFSLVDSIEGLSNETVNSELKGKFALSYRVGSSAPFGANKPVDVNNYSVQVTLSNHNYAFNSNGEASATGKFEILPLDIADVNVKEFKVEMPDKVYTGMTIENEISSVTVTLDGDETIIFKKGANVEAGEVELNPTLFRIIGYLNNVNVGDANATISAGGNFTGTREVLGAFEIVARNVVVEIIDQTSPYGQSLALSNVENVGWRLVDPDKYSDHGVEWDWKADWDASESSSKHYIVYKNDSLNINLAIKDGHYNQKDGSLLVGTYAIVNSDDSAAHLASVNENYKVTFVGSWSGEGDNQKKAGTYTVTRREIVLTIGDLTHEYGTQDENTINGLMNDKASLLTDSYTVSSYQGDAILANDKEKLLAGITLSVVHNNNWSEGTNKWLNVGKYAIVVKYVLGSTASTYYLASGTTDAGYTYKVGDQYTITLAGNFDGEDGEYGADSGVDQTQYKAHAGVFEVTPKSIIIEINHITHEYNGAEPTLDGDDKWQLKKGSSLAKGDTPGILDVKLSKNPGVNVGVYSITGTYTTTGSYIVNFENGINAVTITPRRITVQIKDQNKTYDSEAVTLEQGKGTAWEAKLDNSSTYKEGNAIVNSDDLQITLLNTHISLNAGSYPIVATCANTNYQVMSWTGSWENEFSLGNNFGVKNGEAGTYTIKKCTVTVTIYSQSGVYGNNQHKGIDSTQYNAWVVTEGTVYEGDNLGIAVTIVDAKSHLSEKGKQLNAGWYTIEVTYNNGNYDVTFDCQHNIKTDDNNVTEEDVNSHKISGSWNGEQHTKYTVQNGYRVYPRRLEITVANQEDDYKGTGVKPTVKQKAELSKAWTASSVLNGSMPPFVEGEEEDFAITLSVKPVEGGKWNAGTYEIVGEITNEGDKNNYVIDRIQNGTFTIKPLAVTVNIKAKDYAVYNGNDWSADFNTKSKTVKTFANNDYWTADSVLNDDQELFAQAIQLNLLGEAIAANVYSANGTWRDEADKDIKTNYVVTYEGSLVFTVNKRMLSVAINDATSVYGENFAVLTQGAITCTNDETDTHDQGIIGSDDLGINLLKNGGRDVGKYAITGSWNNNSNYEVTFTGSWDEEGANKDHAGIYTIKPRKLTVNINDQGGVFGGLTYTNLSQLQGTSENDLGWYIVKFTETEGISQHNQDAKTYIIPGDSLQIVLTLNNDTSSAAYAGKCAIKAVCNNANYDVTFQGSWAEDDEYKDKAGTFTVAKRQVTVNVLDQKRAYNGEALTMTGLNSKNRGWTEEVTNDDDNYTVTFVDSVDLGGGRKTAPEIKVSLSVEAAKNVGTYLIHIRITRDDKVIFDSSETELSDTVELKAGQLVVTTNEYEITVVGTRIRTGVESDGARQVKVCGEYVITRKEVTLTIDDKTTTYGEKKLEDVQSELTWEDRENQIVAEDLEYLKEAIQLAIVSANDVDGFIGAGVYAIIAPVKAELTSEQQQAINNYNIRYNGSWSNDDANKQKAGTYIVNKRGIGLRFDTTSSTYGDELPTWTYANCTQIPLNGLSVAIIETDIEAFKKAISFEVLGQVLSNANKLKVGNYAVWMSIDTKTAEGQRVAANYEINFSGLWTGGGNKDGKALDNVAGLYTVNPKEIKVTGITSASNRGLTSEYGDAVPTDWQYEAAEGSVLEGDIVTVAYSTAATERANVGTYPVTVALARANGSNDNANYTMSMEVTVEYTITVRRVKFDDPNVKEIVYGDTREYPEIVVERDGKEGEWNKYASGDPIQGVEVDITVVGETLSTSGFLRVKMQSGEIKGYDITLSLSGDNASNFKITNKTRTFTQKLKVNKRPVTVTIEDRTSVYGESESRLTYTVENTADGRGLAKGDDRSLLSITLTRQGLSEGLSSVGTYAITGTFNCTDYAVKFSGNWSDAERYNEYIGIAGIYTITQRNVRIEIYNQSAPYGEDINVSSVEGTNWKALNGEVVAGTQYYTVKPGDSLGITLKFENEVSGRRTRGAYTLTYDEASVNSNYKVTVVRTALPTGEDAHNAFPNDFDRSATSIEENRMWGYGTPISEELKQANHGMFFVTIRDVDINISDQTGVYGEEFTLPQYEVSGAYTVSLTKDKGTSGAVFIDGLEVTFKLVTTAFDGANTDGKEKGKLSYAGNYPIFSSGITATQNDKTLQDQSLLLNYRFNFKGGWTHDGTYSSGSPYNGRVGVFTVQRRDVTIMVSDVATTYGTSPYTNLNSASGEVKLANQNGYTTLVSNGTGSAFVSTNDEALFNIKLTVKYGAENISTGKALKAGSYNITASKLEDLKGNAAFNSYNVTFASTNPKLNVAKANITINILSGKRGSTYGDKLTVDGVTWNSLTNTDMFDATVSEWYVKGDKLDFDMIASVIDDVQAGRYPAAGNYAIYATWKKASESGDNANYNPPTWTGAFTKGIDSKDDHYANIAGIYTVAKKGIKVKINDAKVEYGEPIDLNMFTYTLSAGWAVGGDTDDALGINLSTAATAGSSVSTYEIKGNANSKNYEVTFKGSWSGNQSGTLTIYPRKIVVVICPQSSVYGSTPAASSDTRYWFVVRGNNLVNSSTQGTSDIWKSVFGGAQEKNMGQLRISLSKGITYLDDSYTWDNINGTFAGDYAITGYCENNNFDVIFTGFISENAEDYQAIYEDSEKATKGKYKVTPLDVNVRILDREGVYGSMSITDGVDLRYGAKLSNTENIAWKYEENSNKFTNNHEQYLNFLLDAESKGNIFADVGGHKIIGEWATNDLGIQHNYNVKFVNGIGTFTITPATIQQNNRSAEGDETFVGTLWNQTQLYRGEEVSYSLKVDPRYFFFAGDLSFGADDKGTATYAAATVTYSNLKKDNQFVIKGNVTEDELNITHFGVWTVDVTIKKANHKDATFTLSLTVAQADLIVTLKDGAKFETEYGNYLADGQAAKGGARTFAQLQEDLKKWLFSTDVIERIDGAENIANNLNEVIEALLKITDDDAITVSIITTAENTSTGGYLNANDYYILNFVGNGNIKIRFAENYSVVRVLKKELNMKWAYDEEDVPSEYSDDHFTYRYDGKDHKVIAMPIGTLDGDLVANFGMQRYLIGKDSVETPQYELMVVGEYRVAVIVDGNSATDGNHDIGNYTVNSRDLYVTIKAVAVKVLIHNQTNEYGEQDIDLTTIKDAWEIIEGKDVLGEGDDLMIVLSLASYAGERRPSGTSCISGHSNNDNYDVTFVGSYGETGKGKNDGTGGTYTVTKRKIIVNVHDITVTYGAYTMDSLKNLNFVTLGDTAYTTRRPDAEEAQNSAVTTFPNDMDSLALSIKLDPTSTQYTSTGYLKANETGYKLLCDYNEESNYDVTFVLDNGDKYNEADKYSKLIVNKMGPLSVVIQSRTVTYGEDRPTMPMNYNVSGFAPNDAEWFNTYRDTETSFLKFTVRDAKTGDTLNENAKYDPVGLYIIILESDTSLTHDIGSNYNIDVQGEWLSDEYYTELNGKAGSYTVSPRTITITLHSASGEYGDQNVAERLSVTINSTAFAPNDTMEDIMEWITFDVTNVFDEEGHTKGVGVYDVSAVMLSPNYTLDGLLTANYEVLPREIDIKVLTFISEYGDHHQDFINSQGYLAGWTATRSNGKTGNAIAYQDKDAIVSNIKLITNASNIADAGDEYRVYVDSATITMDDNYNVNTVTDGTLTIERRKITVRIRPQSSEYGEEPLFENEYGKDWTAERTNKSEFSDENVVVLPRDIYDLVIKCEVSRTSPAGSYDINATFNNNNYVVSVVDGKYTIRPREIFVRIENSTSEYGDNVGELTWSASRVGGNAIVNGDVLDITLKATTTDGTFIDTRTGIGTYPIIATESNNSNYKITFTGDYNGTLPPSRIGDAAGKYEVTKRRIVMTFNGQSEYGDTVDPHSASYRVDGKEGPAIVNGDNLGYTFDWIDDPFEPNNLVNGYPAVGSYNLKVIKPAEPTPEQANYDVRDDVSEYSVYEVVPRKVTIRVKDSGRTYGDKFVDFSDNILGMLDISRTTPGLKGDPILNEDIKFFSLSVIDGDEANLTDGIPYFAGKYNYELGYTLDNPNYELSVIYGNYTVTPKHITVHIDDKTTSYGEDLLELTHSAIEGVLEGDDLDFALSVLWGAEQEGLKWHNAGVYRIEASYYNPNYLLTIEGSLGNAGAYTILKAYNEWIKEYSVERLQQGKVPDVELLPEAKWGDAIIKYYLDKECTQELDINIQDALTGTYYVKVTVYETNNWYGLEKIYTVEVANDFLNIDGTDITLYVCLFASQFLIGLFALIFVGRRKKEKNK